MSAVEWQTGIPTGNHLATYRGIRIVVELNVKRSPTVIGWYIEGRLAECTPVNCDLESAKKIGIAMVDQRIPTDERWQRAEMKARESDPW
jgi:hypothetical protein